MIFLLSLVSFFLGASSQGFTDQGAVTGLGTSISCDHGRQVEAPFWFINGTVYELFSIPLHFPSIVVNSYTALSIPNVTFAVDNTLFSCATFDRNGVVTPATNAIRLLVSRGNNLGSVEQNTMNVLRFDYQRLSRQDELITVGWTFQNICNQNFELQGHTIITNDGATVLPSHVIRAGGSNSSQIPISQLSLNTNETVYYRLVAVGENGNVCSDETSQETFYRFEGEQNTVQLNPTSTSTCFDIPETTHCTASLNFIWPQREKELSCLCPIFDSSGGQSVLVSCVQGCNADIIPYLSNGQVCLQNLDSTMNGTTFRFMCSTDPCPGDCFVKTIIAYHTLLFSEEDVRQVGLYFHEDLECNVVTGQRSPYWIFNDVAYTLTSLLQEFPLFTSESDTLTIFAIPSLNNSLFQCGIVNGKNIVLGIPIRIRINLDLIGEIGDDPDNETILFNYQDLDITSSSVQIGWVASSSICSQFFEVQRVNLEGDVEEVVVRTNSNMASIPLDRIYFRVVAVSINDTVCSNNKSRDTLYRFDEAGQTIPAYKEPNSEACFDVPEGDDIRVAYEQCVCGVAFLPNCGCTYSAIRPRRINTSQICFNSPNSSSMAVHFLLSGRPCECRTSIDNITIVKSYQIIVAEPPSELEIIYSSSSLCFGAQSSIEVTFKYVISTDDGEPDTTSTLTKLRPFCVDDPFPTTCKIFNVTLIATNAIRSTPPYTKSNITSNGCQNEDQHDYTVAIVLCSVIGAIVLILAIVCVTLLVVCLHRHKKCPCWSTYTLKKIKQNRKFR